jgi:hypothetical protein
MVNPSFKKIVSVENQTCLTLWFTRLIALAKGRTGTKAYLPLYIETKKARQKQSKYQQPLVATIAAIR